MLTVIDEFTRRCMAVVVERRLNSDNVLHCLTELFVQHGPPDHIRSDNGSEFTAHAVRDWLGRIGVKTLYIEFTRRCMAVVVERRLNSDNVLHCLTELFVQHGPPDHIRSDNGSEFTAHAVRDWLGRIGVKTLYIDPGHLGRTDTTRASTQPTFPS